MKGLPVAQKAELGQVWTPAWVVGRILDGIGYTVDNPQILTATILEPSFGAGAFLEVIVDRLIAAARLAGLAPEAIASLIGQQVWGIEYDQVTFDVTRAMLDARVHESGVPPVTWQFHRQDALTFTHPTGFDYVVGNPPYIRVHDMDATLRAHVKAFNHGTGTTDLYVIFFELGLALLKPGGKLGYITPNSFLRNTSQGKFRAMLIEQQLIEGFTDFGSRRIFDDAATYPIITVLSKRADPVDIFKYTRDTGDAATGYVSTVAYADLTDNPRAPLVFADAADTTFLQEVSQRPHRLGDILNIQYGVATLRDKIYTTPSSDVESVITRPVVKASTYKGGPVTERILFPYIMDKAGPHIIPEDVLREQYPRAHAFLQTHEQELLQRDRDRGSLWYAYGRSQGLARIGEPKIVLSHVVAAAQTHLNTHIMPAETIVYSGMFITATDPQFPLTRIKAILESEDFCRFVKIHGKDMSGGYKSFTPKTLQTYRVA